MSNIAISVNNVSKMYKLYDNPMDRLKESLGLTRQKRYKEHYALNDVSFRVGKGETVGIIGTNGSGKSTILKIITGVLNATKGDVAVNGRISALLELGAGFNMEYTGIENVYLNSSMIGFTKEEVDAKLEAILDFADIGDFVYQPCKTYSSGMFVRLAFAVAINIEPEILIVDEALSVGDVFFQAKCYRKFEEFKKMGKTILIVSHDLSSISKYCDRVVLLNKGKKLAEGQPKEMVDLYKKVLVGQAGNEEDLNQLVEEQLSDVSAQPEETSANDKQWVRPFDLNPQQLEYGSKKAEIVDFTIRDAAGNYSNAVEKGSDFEILVRVKFHEKIQEPIVAYTFKNIHGTEITGTNTMYEHKDIGQRLPDDEIVVSFKQNMSLQGGEYLLSLGCTGYHDGEFTVFHRLYDICNVTVVSTKNTVGYFDMNSQVSVQEG